MLKEWNIVKINPVFHYSSIPLRYSSLLPRHSLSAGQSGNHSALEHLIGDGTGHAVEELSAHLRILAQHLDRFLF
jgi:hypothetical protein